jgi:hypothetical protein
LRLGYEETKRSTSFLGIKPCQQRQGAGSKPLARIFKVAGAGALVEFGSADSLAGKSIRYPI